MLAKSHYLTLGIPQNESAGGIRRAFREHVKRYHPDRVGSARARFFQEIVEAYHTLSSPERRRAYDRGLSHAEGGAAAVPAVSLAKHDGAVGLGESLDPRSDDPSGRLPQVAPVLRFVLGQRCALRSGVGPSQQEPDRRELRRRRPQRSAFQCRSCSRNSKRCAAGLSVC